MSAGMARMRRRDAARGRLMRTSVERLQCVREGLLRIRRASCVPTGNGKGFCKQVLVLLFMNYTV